MKSPNHLQLLPLLNKNGASGEMADTALATELSQPPLAVRDGTSTMDRAGAPPSAPCSSHSYQQY